MRLFTSLAIIIAILLLSTCSLYDVEGNAYTLIATEDYKLIYGAGAYDACCMHNFIVLHDQGADISQPAIIDYVTTTCTKYARDVIRIAPTYRDWPAYQPEAAPTPCLQCL